MKPVGGLVEDRDVAGASEVPAQRKESTLPVGELVDPPHKAAVAVEGERGRGVVEDLVPELPFDARFSGPPGQFPASMVGVAGDVAAVSSCLSLLPRGWALATLDFTIKMTGVAKGDKLRAKGRVLQAGRTNSVGAADVYVVSAERETLCGTVLATTRNFQIKPPAESSAVITRESG